MKESFLQRLNRTFQVLAARLELALMQLGLPPKVAMYVRKAIWWLSVLSFATLTVLSVIQEAWSAQHTTVTEELVHYSDGPAPGESADQFRARLHGYAGHIIRASEGKRLGARFLRAAMVSLGGFESKYNKAVCENFVHAKRGNPAVSCWQTEVTSPKSVAEAAEDAAKYLQKAYFYCAGKTKDNVAAMYSLYATGRTCSWPEGKQRAARFRSIYYRMGDEQ